MRTIEIKSKKDEEINTIKIWLTDCWEEKFYENFSHIHLDQIDETIEKSPEQWLKTGLDFLFIANEFRKASKVPLSLALFITLSTKTCPSGFNIKSEEDLINQLDNSPPAIYLLDEKSQAWIETPKVIILPNQINFIPKEIRCFFSEFINKSSEVDYFVRSLFLMLD